MKRSITFHGRRAAARGTRSSFAARSAFRSSSLVRSASLLQARSLATAAAESKMFCYQCEQTDKGTGCTTIGVCGKTPEVSAMQDLLVHGLKGIAMYANRARKLAGLKDAELDRFMLRAIFSTLTNVNFDEHRFSEGFLAEASKMKDRAKALYAQACRQKGQQPETLSGPATFSFRQGLSTSQIVEEGKKVGVLVRKEQFGPDLTGLQELVMYGLKGLGAYAEHAFVLDVEDDKVYEFVHEALDALTKPPVVEELLGLALKVGEVNLRVMEMLDQGGTSRYGHPEPTKVITTHKKGKCILVSGHDLRDIEEVLKQTAGKGINVYTHGEMLPAHGYPGLKKKYPHLVGNYGGAWQQQKFEFGSFPGPIVMTTNCIIEPRKSYKDRIYTRSVVGWPGVQHIEGYNFASVVEKALSMEGFKDDEPEKFTMTGFARNAVLSNAGEIVDAVKGGAIKHFFLIGGCDGAEGERNYFKEVALSTPKDTMVLTLACGKYRFNKFFDQFGNIGPFPRMLDVGQCNDAYSAIQIAAGLAKAFNTDVNSLPLSFVISWFEQKAVAVLLTLLHLGVKNIYLGPNLPAFATPNILNVLVSTFQLKKIGDPTADVKAMLSRGSEKKESEVA